MCRVSLKCESRAVAQAWCCTLASRCVSRLFGNNDHVSRRAPVACDVSSQPLMPPRHSLRCRNQQPLPPLPSSMTALREGPEDTAAVLPIAGTSPEPSPHPRSLAERDRGRTLIVMNTSFRGEREDMKAAALPLTLEHNALTLAKWRTHHRCPIRCLNLSQTPGSSPLSPTERVAVQPARREIDTHTGPRECEEPAAAPVVCWCTPGPLISYHRRRERHKRMCVPALLCPPRCVILSRRGCKPPDKRPGAAVTTEAGSVFYCAEQHHLSWITQKCSEEFLSGNFFPHPQDLHPTLFSVSHGDTRLGLRARAAWKASRQLLCPPGGLGPPAERRSTLEPPPPPPPPRAACCDETGVPCGRF